MKITNKSGINTGSSEFKIEYNGYTILAQFVDDEQVWVDTMTDSNGNEVDDFDTKADMEEELSEMNFEIDENNKIKIV